MKNGTFGLIGIALLGISTFAALPAADEAGKAADGKQILERFASEFVSLTPGKGQFPASFVMGSAQGPTSEQPAHKVTFAYSFAVAKYEVTQELYETVIGKNPSRWKGPRNSLEIVSWDEANTFCSKATAALRRAGLLKNGETIRLPTEAEWEYACRAGTTSKFSFGDSEKELGLYGWFTGNAKGNDPPAGAKRANPWGLFDMHGYVWEWCADSWYQDYKDVPSDGSAPVSAPKPLKGSERVLRGGAWTEVADHCRSAYRHHASADTGSDAIGFRCVKKGSGHEK
jgi:formylglycine-generating enzyme required for sulfatase activity